MPGVGKTQIATAVAYRLRDRFPGGVFWLTMDPPESIASQVAALGGPEGMALAGWDPRHADQNRARVERAWQAPVDRLLVFDNLEDPTLLVRWQPKVGGCPVLITSRNATWSARLGVQRWDLGTLPRSDSLTMLLTPRAITQGRTAADLLADPPPTQEAEYLCAWLDELPLALALAAAYLESYPNVTLASILFK